MNEIKPEAYLHIVKPIAGKFKKRASAVVKFDDMVGIGNIALIMAAKAYDPTRGIPFENFASIWIAGAIRNHIRDKGGPAFRVARSSRDRWHRILQLNLQGKSDAEIAEQIGCEVDQVRQARADMHIQYVSLDHTFEDGNDPVYEIADYADWTSVDVRIFIASLSKHEREVVELRMADISQSEIARRFGVSQMTISRTLRKIGAKYLKGGDGDERGGHVLRQVQSAAEV